MEQNEAFSYTYSPAVNREVQEIRKKYMPQEESKLDELKRLDQCVRTAGIAQSLTLGITGTLLFGLGMCMGMKVIGGGMIPGILLGILGMLNILLAYPLNRKLCGRMKEKHTARILQLTDELMNK